MTHYAPLSTQTDCGGIHGRMGDVTLSNECITIDELRGDDD
jgi:hypothetical protein